MATWKVYGYDKCDTCRKALKFLDAKKIAYQKIDITVQPPTLAELQRMLKEVGDVRKLFNTSGQAYREGKVGEKLPGLSSDEALTLLAANGRLIKRPFVLYAKGGLVGFRPPEWEKALS